MEIAVLFENRMDYLEKFDKQQYKEAFETYQQQIQSFFDACDERYATEESVVQTMCTDIAAQICTFVDKHKLKVPFKNRVQEESWQEKMNLFMAAYLFPAIMECRNGYYKELCKAIEKKWTKTFRASKIKAATFETVESGFHKKAFGLF